MKNLDFSPTLPKKIYISGDIPPFDSEKKNFFRKYFFSALKKIFLSKKFRGSEKKPPMIIFLPEAGLMKLPL